MINATYRDTAGQERFHTITTSYYRGAMVLTECVCGGGGEERERECNIHCHIWNDDHMLVTLCAPSLSVNEHLCPLSYCCYPCTSDVYSMYNVMHMTANS